MIGKMIRRVQYLRLVVWVRMAGAERSVGKRGGTSGCMHSPRLSRVPLQGGVASIMC